MLYIFTFANYHYMYRLKLKFLCYNKHKSNALHITGGLDRSLTAERFPHYEVMTKESTLKDEVLIYKNVSLVCIHCN